MAFAIMRMAKIKDTRGVVMAAQHNSRERQPLNADPEKKPENLVMGGNSGDVLGKFERLTYGVPKRKNSVVAVEMVMTASPEFDGDWDGYLKASQEWAKELFGEKNLLHSAVHKDEKTPHLHLLFTPLLSAGSSPRFNASYYIGGHRNRMAELQTDFFEKVGKRFGMERGHSAEESRTRHSHHTLKGRSDELDQREEKVMEKETKLKEAEALIKKNFGLTLKELEALKELGDRFLRKMKPADFELQAKYMRQAGVDNLEALFEKKRLENARTQTQGIKP